MSSLFKMPNRPYWFTQITLPNGERLPRKSTKEKSKREAERRAAEMETEAIKQFKANNLGQGRAYHRLVEDAARLAEQGRLTPSKAEELIRQILEIARPEDQKVTLRIHYEDWISRSLKGLSKSHRDNNNTAKRDWLGALGKKADKPIASLSVKDLDSAFSKVAKDSTSSTANLKLSSLRQALDDALRRRLIDDNPAKSVKTIKAKQGDKSRKKRGPFTLDEVRKLMKQGNEEWQGMILFGVHTGLRMMDIAELSHENIEDGLLQVTSAKSATNTSTPLHPQLVKWLGDRQGHLFPTIRTKAKSNVSQTFSNLMAKAKVPKEVKKPSGEILTRSFHSLRHTFTSILANANVSEETRKALTGQKNSKVHQQYTHLDTETLQTAVNKLPTL